jgi:hypothetical protein
MVSQVASPLGGEVAFSSPLHHRRIGSGWSWLGHGYQGDVYMNQGEETLTLTLPPDTVAFYFYVHASGSTIGFHVTAEDGTDSGGMWSKWDFDAPYIGFYATDGDTLATLTIEADEGHYGIADFGIAVPEPSLFTVFSILGAASCFRREKRVTVAV